MSPYFFFGSNPYSAPDDLATSAMELLTPAVVDDICRLVAQPVTSGPILANPERERDRNRGEIETERDRCLVVFHVHTHTTTEEDRGRRPKSRKGAAQKKRK